MEKLLADALSADDHAAFVEHLDDQDLATALGAAIAVAERDVGPSLRAAAEHDGIAFHVV